MVLIDTIRSRINAHIDWVLACSSLFCAIVGGAAAAACWVGGLVAGLAGALPMHAGLVLALGLAIAGICDVLRDLFPNRFAIYAALFLPSLFRLVKGDVGTKVHGWTDAINAWSTQHMGTAFGETSVTFVATAGFVGAIILSNRVASHIQAAKAKAAAAATAATTPAAGTGLAARLAARKG